MGIAGLASCTGIFAKGAAAYSAYGEGFLKIYAHEKLIKCGLKEDTCPDNGCTSKCTSHPSNCSSLETMLLDCAKDCPECVHSKYRSFMCPTPTERPVSLSNAADDSTLPSVTNRATENLLANMALLLVPLLHL